jgi:hypothetical protein
VREGRVQMIKDNRPISFRTERTEQRQMNKKELIKENFTKLKDMNKEN